MELMNYGMPMEPVESTDAMDNPGLEADDAMQDTLSADVESANETTMEGEAPSEEKNEPQEEKPSRRRRKVKDGAAPAAPEDGEPLPGPAEDDGESDDPEDDHDPEAGADEPDSPPPERQPGTVRRSRLVLNSSGRAIREQQDYGQADLSVLSAARNRREVLTATLDSYEPDSDGMFQVFFMVGKVKVIIPWQEMGFSFDSDRPDPVELRLRLLGMTGAIIDYMVRGIDTENLLAVASRHDAMIVRQARILNRHDADGNYMVDVGTRCMARVLEVGERFVRMEVFGYDFSLPIRAISNLWVNDAREVIEIGREYPVEITRITRDPETGRVIRLDASMREAEEKTPTPLVAGNTYTGTVCSISRTAYYVHVKGIPLDVRCPIRSNYESGMMVGDFVRFYVSGVYDGRAAGAITRILKRPAP